MSRLSQRTVGAVYCSGGRAPRRWALLAFTSLAMGLGCGGGEADSDASLAPSESRSEGGALGRVASSRSGRHRISVRPASEPVALGAMHEWIVRVERTDGAPARPTTVIFDGGMPSHGHGFVTAPRVTRELGDGEFLVEGVKFHMAGAWELRVAVTSAEGSDKASFDISVAP